MPVRVSSASSGAFKWSWSNVAAFAAVLLAVSPVAFPSFTWHTLMVIDGFYPFMYKSSMVDAYHKYLVSTLPGDVEPEEVPILMAADASYDSLNKITNGYTTPVVIKGALADVPAVRLWANRSFWLDNYGDENIMCGYKSKKVCKIRDAFGVHLNESERMYIEGESLMFERFPELVQQFQSDLVDRIMPSGRVFIQMFAGFPGMGHQDIHGAIGINAFQMITGRKKWVLIPQYFGMTPYLYALMNPWDHFSSWTKTKVAKGPVPASPWLSKIRRITLTLEPGDVLVYAPWTWHAVENVGEDPDELVIGVPVRYHAPGAMPIPAFKANWVLSSFAWITMMREYSGGCWEFISKRSHLQGDIQAARNRRRDEVMSMTKIRAD